VKLLLFLARSSRWLLGCAVATSLISGFVGASLVASINQALSEPREGLDALAWRFAGLSLVALFTRWLSQTQFVELSQRTLAQLRSHLTRHLAEVPFREIEQRGSAKLLAVLSEDVHSVSHFFVMLPELLMHGAVVLGCLIYLAMLSWQVFLFALVMVLLGSLGYHLADVRALDAFARSSRVPRSSSFIANAGVRSSAICSRAASRRCARPARPACASTRRPRASARSCSSF
jgi:putative ATP-binding cassette transporter